MRYKYPRKPVFRVDSDGYILVYLPAHPRAQRSPGYVGFVLEHIVVASNMLGRDLATKEQVHHLDFNRHRNSPTNLLVLEGKQHTKLHQWLERANYRPSIRSFTYSSATDYVAQALRETARCEVCLYPIRKDTLFCSHRCSNYASRKVKRPSIKRVVKLVQETGFLGASRIVGVSDNAIRGWLRRAGIDPNSLSGRRP